MALASIPLFPEAASTMAPKVDQLYIFLVSISGFMTLLIFAFIAFFSVKYRRRSEDERPRATKSYISLEILWSVIPFGIFMMMFVWGARLYFLNAQVPKNAMQVYVVGKQWMWKIQHPEGPREIDELHVPVNRPVQLIISSQDVIHSFYMPAFRIKRDAVPGTYTTAWFQATKTGEYHLFCAEYCGTDHSRMRGRIVVMEDADYQQWLSGGAKGESMASAGRQLFERLGCMNCHKDDGSGRCPPLRGVYGRGVGLAGGGTVVADEAYLRESILDPGAKIVAGYPNIMPTFRGVVNEDGLMQLIAYLKSLGGPEAGAPGAQTQQRTPALSNPRTPQAAAASETGSKTSSQSGERPR
jgi:cytochrome c oxidase subunit 2